jgi:flagellar protein FliT
MNNETMTRLLSHYEAINQSSQAMLQAARNSDWDALVTAEQRCAALIKHVQAEKDAAGALDAEGRKRKHEIILKVLAADAEIRTLTQPWVLQLERWLINNRKSQSVAQAYRA